MMHDIWTWNSAPDVYFWSGGSGGGRSRSLLPELRVNGLTVGEVEAVPLLGKRLGERPLLIGGVPVVSADEAVIDLCRYAHPIEAWVGATGLMRQSLKYHRSVPAEHRVEDHLRRARLQSKLELVAGSKGIVQGRMVLDGVDSRSESVAEAALLWLLHTIVEPRNGTMPFQPQLPISTEEGRFHADVGFPEERLIIEFDGLGKFREDSRSLNAHLRRQNAITREGWTIFPVLWEDFLDMEGLGKRLAKTLLEFGVDAHPPSGILWADGDVWR